MNDIGKVLFLAGLILMLVGAVIWWGLGRGWLGRLPGDLHYSKGDLSFHFPIVTGLLISLVLTFVVWLFRK